MHFIPGKIPGLQARNLPWDNAALSSLFLGQHYSMEDSGPSQCSFILIPGLLSGALFQGRSGACLVQNYPREDSGLLSAHYPRKDSGLFGAALSQEDSRHA